MSHKKCTFCTNPVFMRLCRLLKIAMCIFSVTFFMKVGVKNILISKEYVEYMKSDEWQKIKHSRLEIDHYSCVMCGYSKKPEILMVHHLNYKRLCHEDVWKDLVTLCPVCHRKVHRMLKRKQEPGTKYNAVV